MSAFETVISRGGVVLFPSDTVYGLACDPASQVAIEHLYALKGRPPDKAAAVMFFDLDAALEGVSGIGERTQAAIRQLMPGPVTALLRNPDRRFPLACRADPDTLGLRIVDVAALGKPPLAVLQSSANPAGGTDARTIGEVAPALRDGVDLVIDGGELPGVASTVVDLRDYELGGAFRIVRQGAVDEQAVAATLSDSGRW